MPTSTPSTSSDSQLRPRSRAAALWPALVAAVLGVVIVYVVGFAGAHTIHEAAHDARHSLNFPCH
jgi:cobalt transporter subunit CbtB